jgi:hypothetical protein
MDTIIFGMILAALASTRTRSKLPAIAWFLAALTATALLFASHVTDPLPLNF